MKNLTIVFIVFISILQTSICIGQSSTALRYERVYIEGGVQVPIGNLKNRIMTAPNVGFWFKTEVRSAEFIEIGFNS